MVSLEKFFCLPGHTELIDRFNYVHSVMKIPHERILKNPDVLTSRRHRLQQRFEFLKHLNKAQFNERKPNFIPLKSLISGTEKEFIVGVCNSSLEEYDSFIKTL